MKITAIDVYVLNGRPPVWRPVVCRVCTDEGIEGWGEATVAFDIGATAAFSMICEAAPMLLGCDPMDHEVLWNKMFTGSFWTQSGGTILMSAVSALDTALWDIKGKVMQMPVYKLLGGKFRKSLRCYASQLQFGWGRDGMQHRGTRTEEFVEDVLAAVEDGYSAVKINIINFDRHGNKLGYLNGPLTADVRAMIRERAEAIRSALGDQNDFILEHHGRTNVASTVEIAKLTEHLNIMFIEEPCAPTDLDAMIRISQRIAQPLAAGERLHSKSQYLRLMENHAIGVVQPDVGNCGGITMTKKLSDFAEAYNIGVQLHVCGSPIAEAASIQIEAAIPSFVIHEHMIVARDKRNIDLGLYRYEPKNGQYEVPDKPGIGQELSEYAIKTALYTKTITA
jgi:L-alanine-DL-glutamate epimerase-like enolase superfamily enzyme